MGRIVDKAKTTENGKFRPWIRRMAGPVALASFLMYQSSLAGASMTVKVVVMFTQHIYYGDHYVIQQSIYLMDQWHQL